MCQSSWCSWRCRTLGLRRAARPKALAGPGQLGEGEGEGEEEGEEEGEGAGNHGN